MLREFANPRAQIDPRHRLDLPVGGEEFVFLMPETDTAATAVLWSGFAE